MRVRRPTRPSSRERASRAQMQRMTFVGECIEVNISRMLPAFLVVEFVVANRSAWSGRMPSPSPGSLPRLAATRADGDAVWELRPGEHCDVERHARAFEVELL